MDLLPTVDNTLDLGALSKIRFLLPWPRRVNWLFGTLYFVFKNNHTFQMYYLLQWHMCVPPYLLCKNFMLEIGVNFLKHGCKDATFSRKNYSCWYPFFEAKYEETARVMTFKGIKIHTRTQKTAGGGGGDLILKWLSSGKNNKKWSNTMGGFFSFKLICMFEWIPPPVWFPWH